MGSAAVLLSFTSSFPHKMKWDSFLTMGCAPCTPLHRSLHTLSPRCTHAVRRWITCGPALSAGATRGTRARVLDKPYRTGGWEDFQGRCGGGQAATFIAIVREVNQPTPHKKPIR
jgi:hypothetical protein